MYVYYDARGEIKGITPGPTEGLESFQYTTAPLADVEKFLTGQANPFDFQVKIVAGKPGKITKKELKKFNPRSKSQFLTEIEKAPARLADIIVTLDSDNARVVLDVNPNLLSIYNSYDDDEGREELDKVVQSVLSRVYVTEYKNPYNLRSSFSFDIKRLFDEGSLSFDLADLDFSDVSLYTRKVFDNYALKRI